MKKGSSFLKKLAQYSALASPVLAVAPCADAQIAYTDIVPDTVLDVCYEQYTLDLNNDGVTDFKFKAYGVGTYWAIVKPFPYTSQNQNAIAGTFPNWEAGAFPYALNAGQQIDENLNWVSMADLILRDSQMAGLEYPETWEVMAWYYIDASSSDFLAGNWNDRVDKYLPLRISAGGNTYYGWARLSVTHASVPFAIKDYAINLEPDIFIVAGDTTGLAIGAPEITNDQNSISLFPNPNHGEFTVGIQPKGFKDAILSVLNVMGEKVFEKKISSSENLYSENLDLRGLPKGIYIVHIRSGEKISKGKFVIE